jgi:hypothetical protein
MGVLYDHIDPGILFSADSFNSPVASLQTYINNLDANSLSFGALGSQHLDGLIDQSLGLPADIVWEGAGDHSYDTLYDVGDFGHDSNGREPISPDGSDLELLFSTITLDPTGAQRIGSLLVLLNVHYINSLEVGAAVGMRPWRLYWPMICLQYRDLAGTWRTIDISERICSERQTEDTANNDNLTFQDMSVMLFLTADLIPVPCTGIRAVAGMFRITGPIGSDRAEVLLRECRLTAIPLHCAVSTF